jgi:hypothetical protein
MNSSALAPTSEGAPLRDCPTQPRSAPKAVHTVSLHPQRVTRSKPWSSASPLQPPPSKLAVSGSTTSLCPQYYVIASRWWEELAQNLLGASCNLNQIICICEFDLFADPKSSIVALCMQPDSRLDDLLTTLGESRRICHDKSRKAEQIVHTLRGEISPGPAWDGDWLFSAMSSPMDVSAIAVKLDWSICLVFCKLTYGAWVKWVLGYRDDGISNFLNAVLTLRNNVSRFLRSASLGRWELLEEVCVGDSFIVDRLLKFVTRPCGIDILWRIG